MTEDRSRPGASSTSLPRPSPPSRRSAAASSTSASAGSRASRAGAGLGADAIRALAARHGIHPSKALGQHFLIDPNLARAIVADAGVGPGDRVVEVGAGLGSLTLALAAAGARVRAIEFDRAVLPALREATEGTAGVEIVAADATRLDWDASLGAEGPWILCANLPYNVSVPVVLAVLETAPAVTRLAILVQREVGERLVARAGEEHYGPASVRVAYHASGGLLRRVPPSVFWPRPRVSSVVVRLDRLVRPPVDVASARLWRVVDAGFAERRKAMRSVVVRLGVDPGRADDLLRGCGIDPRTRAEQLPLEAFARIAEALA